MSLTLSQQLELRGTCINDFEGLNDKLRKSFGKELSFYFSHAKDKSIHYVAFNETHYILLETSLPEPTEEIYRDASEEEHELDSVITLSELLKEFSKWNNFKVYQYF